MDPNPKNPPRPPPSALAIPPEAVCFSSPVKMLPPEELVDDPGLDGFPNEMAERRGFALRERAFVVPPRLETFGTPVDDALSDWTSLPVVLLLDKEFFLDFAIFNFRSPFLL